MTAPDETTARLRAMAAAVALTTAVGLQDQSVDPADLLGDADPLQVLRVLSAALHAALGATVGASGRRLVLRHLGLAAADDGGSQ